LNDLSVEITKSMVAAVTKAELTSANVLAKMGAVTTETGTHQFDAIVDAIILIGKAAGLGGDVKGLDGITRALKKELPGVAAEKIRVASEDIAALGRRQLGLHFQGVQRGRMQGRHYTASADDLSESVLKKVRGLKVALTFFANALKYAAAPVLPQRPAPAAQTAPAAPKVPAAPQSTAVVRGGGGTVSYADAVATLKATRGAEAATQCPFMATAKGCDKPNCRYKH
jgi:hypothetical protein